MDKLAGTASDGARGWISRIAPLVELGEGKIGVGSRGSTAEGLEGSPVEILPGVG
jgi:hypothetical protein